MNIRPILSYSSSSAPRFSAGLFLGIPIRHHQRKLDRRIVMTNTGFDYIEWPPSSMKKLKALVRDIMKRFPKARIRVTPIKAQPNNHWAGIDTTVGATHTTKELELSKKVDAYLFKRFAKRNVPYQFHEQSF